MPPFISARQPPDDSWVVFDLAVEQTIYLRQPPDDRWLPFVVGNPGGPIPAGVNPGDILIWNGAAWVPAAFPSPGGFLPGPPGLGYAYIGTGVNAGTWQEIYDVRGNITLALAGNPTIAGDNNVLFGVGAGALMTTDRLNIGIGLGALGVAQGSLANVALGYYAGAAITIGSYNVLIGGQAGSSLTDGGNNVILGTNAVQYGQHLSSIVAIGNLAASMHGGGNYCVWIGAATGEEAQSTAGANTCVGTEVAPYISTGSANSAVGVHALYQIQDGSYNSTLGQASLYAVTTGTNHIALGYLSDLFCPAAVGVLTATNGSANLSVGQYIYKVSFVLDGSETGLSQSLTDVVTTDAGNREVTIAGLPTYAGPLLCSARKIYRTKVGASNSHAGAGLTPFYLVGTVAGNVTTGFVDNVADAALVTTHIDPSGCVLIGVNPPLTSDPQLRTCTKSGQIILGTVGVPYTELWIGQGQWSTVPTAFLFSATGGSGANVAGGDLVVQGGPGTGSAKSGDVIFKAAPAGAAGSLRNAPTEVVRIGTTSSRSLAAQNAATNGTAVYGTATGSGTTNGGSFSCSGTAASISNALYAENTTNTGTQACGLNATINGNGTTSIAGRLVCTATGTSAYGAYCYCAGAAATNVACYCHAANGTKNYALIADAGQVGIGTSAPSACALVEVVSTTQGFRLPNMTTAQKNAIGTPLAGLMVFDTDLAKACLYTGAGWETIVSA